MADFREWGAEESGVRVAEQDAQKRALFEIMQQKAPVELDMLKSHAQLYRAQAAEHEEKVNAARSRQAALEKWLANRAPGKRVEDTLENASGTLMDLAELEIASGNTNGARQILGTMSQVQARGATIANREAQTEAAQFKLLHDMNNYAANLARNARTPEQWAQIGPLFKRLTGQAAPEVFSQPFSPQLRDQVVASSMSAAQAATAEYQKRRAAAAENQAVTAAGSLALRKELGQRELELRESRERRLEKAAGRKSLNAPSREERLQVEALVRQQYPKITGDDLKVAGTSIGSAAKKLLRKNPGLNFEQAAAQAFKSQARFFDTSGSKPTFRSVGRTPERALPMPQTKDQAKAGLFYKTPRGIAQYLGGGRFDDPVEVDNEDDDEE